MDYADLVSGYCAGPQMLRAALAGMTAEQLDARPIPGKWSTKQVFCHECHVVDDMRLRYETVQQFLELLGDFRTLVLTETWLPARSRLGKSAFPS